MVVLEHATYFPPKPKDKQMIIMAIDLGKYKSMVCYYNTETQEYTFETVTTERAYFLMRIKRKKGSGVARVAVMRRMATIIWHMLTKRKTYAEIRCLRIGLQDWPRENDF